MIDPDDIFEAIAYLTIGEIHLALAEISALLAEGGLHHQEEDGSFTPVRSEAFAPLIAALNNHGIPVEDEYSDSLLQALMDEIESRGNHPSLLREPPEDDEKDDYGFALGDE